MVRGLEVKTKLYAPTVAIIWAHQEHTILIRPGHPCQSYLGLIKTKKHRRISKVHWIRNRVDRKNGFHHRCREIKDSERATPTFSDLVRIVFTINQICSWMVLNGCWTIWLFYYVLSYVIYLLKVQNFEW